jgi:N-acetylmuramoyl-L-alanine amidase
MAKIARLLFLIFFTCSTVFSATNYLEDLKLYDKQIETSSKDELLRIYHGLKSIYIHSIVSNDNNLKKEVLKRLIKSSSELNLDASHYAKELDTLTKNTKPQETKQITKETQVEKKQELQKESVKKKVEEKKAEPLLSYNAYPILRNIVLDDEHLLLEFDKELKNGDIKYFQLKSSKAFREVYDIKGILTKNYNIKVPKGLDNLRIAQYNKSTIRVVLQREKAHKSLKKVDNTDVRIYFDADGVGQKETKKTYTYSKQIASKKTIVIDAGHGGRDGGAVGYKNKVEKKAVLSIALAVGEELKQRGYKVHYTRDKDKFIQLRDRTKLANDKNADLFISIHANAAPHKKQYFSHKGLETYFLSPARSQRSKNIAELENKSDIEEMDYFSKQTFLNVFNREKIIFANKLALDVQQEMLNSLRKSYKVTDGGVREAPFWVLVGAQMPSILIEVGYITNPTEAERMFNPHYQKLLAEGAANGIDSYFIRNN